jgi:iron complex outermembrane receptor protein
MHQAYSQLDSIYEISEIQIIDSFSFESNQKFNLENEPSIKATNISEILNRKANIFVKNFGAVSSSTLSIRGGSANQALLTWNDVPINNPMLGLSDISLIPVQLFDQIEVNKGGNSSEYGNGAITGVINLNSNSLRSDKPISLGVNYGIGSYGLRQGAVNFSLNKGKWSSTTKLFHTSSKNNFKYELGNSIRENVHSNFNTTAWLQAINYSISPHQHISIQSWWQDTFREIPPTTTQNISEAVQIDRVLRLFAEYKLNKSMSTFSSKLAYFDEDNDFEDPQILIASENRFKRILSKSSLSMALNNDIIFKGIIELSHARGQSQSYEQTETLSSLSTTASVKKIWHQSHLAFSLRHERNSIGRSFTSPTIIYHNRLSDHWHIQAKISREFRFPTLNELFWRPGGNTDLDSEHGWNQELDFSYNKQNKHSITFSLFHRRINDWILWSLAEGSNFFAPINISKVRSYGIELQGNKHMTLGQLQLDLNANYNYTISENLSEVSLPKINLGDQLFYTPKHQFSLNATATYKKIKININGQHTSTTLGIIEVLDSYSLLNADLAYALEINNHKITISLTANNITDTEFRIIERRPMVGRNFLININYNL